MRKAIICLCCHFAISLANAQTKQKDSHFQKFIHVLYEHEIDIPKSIVDSLFNQRYDLSDINSISLEGVYSLPNKNKLIIFNCFEKKRKGELLLIFVAGTLSDIKYVPTECFICSFNELFARVNFIPKKSDMIKIVYFKPVFLDRPILSDDMEVVKTEVFTISKRGKFITAFARVPRVNSIEKPSGRSRQSDKRIEQ